MKKVLLICAIIAVAAIGLRFALKNSRHKWSGVDETVVEKYAKAAGREAHEPFVPTDRGDLPLFFFLIAGAAGGFAAGYCYRELFAPTGTKP
jgi:hypothetical protein